MMKLTVEEAVQFQNDLVIGLAAALDRAGVLPRNDLADYLYAISKNSLGNRRTFFEMMAETCRSRSPSPVLRFPEEGAQE